MESSSSYELKDIKSSNMGKFSGIDNKKLAQILSFLSPRENVCMILEVNASFAKIISKMYRKESSLTSCIKDLKIILKSIDEYRNLISNHCLNIDDSLKKLKDSYTPFTFNRSLYLISSIIFKDLTVIELQKFNIGMDGVVMLMSFLKTTKSLSSLNLSYNNLADDGCKFLAKGLVRNNSLQVLSLECNCITDQGLKHLTEMLASHRVIKTVKFALNSVTFEGVKSLASVLEKSSGKNIQYIDFKYNNIGPKEDAQIEYFRKLKIML